MIQRKQSLFLLAVFITAILTMFIPFLDCSHSIGELTISLLSGLTDSSVSSSIYYPFALNALVIILSVITTFKFNNRNLQYKLANLLIVINMSLVGLFFLLSYTDLSAVKPHLVFSTGAFLPIISAIFAFLASHYIKKDEQLVRSVDRIR